MSHSYSRDKLEESRRRKRAQQAAQQQRASLPSTNSWRGVTPSQVARPAQQTTSKTTAPQQNKTAPKTQTPQQNIQSAIRSGVSYRGITPTQVTRNVSQPVVSLPVIHAAQERAQQVAQNDNTRRARAARAREGQRQAAQANAAALKKDRAALAANSLKWHQTSDAAERRRLEAENSAIRARRGYAYDSRTGSTYDKSGNELTLAARQIYGGRAETAKQFRDVAQTKDFMRDTSRTASQPSVLDVARGVTADNPYYAIRSGQKAHSIIANLLNRSDETWTDADTKARDEARDALQKEMQAIYQQYGAAYQPRLSADETVKDLALRGADEQTLAYVRENLRLRDASDRLGQGLTAVGKRLEASIPSFVDTVKQAISNQSENKENEAFTRLEEQEKQLELQLQNMQSQDENGRVPADYQEVYDQLQRVREEKNSLKVTKGVDQNLWSQKVLREANEAQANAEAGLAPAPRWVTEQAISLASNAPTMAASAVPVVGPALGSLVMGAQAAGQRAFELNEQGKSAGEALSRGTVSGIIEAATEKLPLERMAEILHSGGTNAVKNILRQMGTEATEEGISYFLNYVSDLAAADPDAKFSLAELAQSAAGGAFGGLVFGAAGAVGAKLANNDTSQSSYYDSSSYDTAFADSMRRHDAELRAAQSLPDGPIKEQAVQTARNKMAQTLENYASGRIAQQAETAAQNGAFDQMQTVPPVQRTAEQTAVQSPAVQESVPVQELMQYGKTPEQAMREAKAKAEGERVREAMNRPEMHEARMIAERLGAKFEVADLGTAGGKYENGTITINPYTNNPVRQVLVHELTHHLENSGAYNDLQAAALRAFSEEQGVSADVLRQNITKLYAERGVTLDQDGANRELTAAFCEDRLFKDENSIQRLAQTDVSLFQRIRQWLSDLVIRLRGTEEQKRVLEVQRLYEKAARNVGAVQDRGAQYTFGREYDNETLAKAVQMEQEGADKDTIWNTLGVIRDTKGNWINEIDDSQMNYDEFGLHQLRKDPDFRRLEELEDKANANAENFGFSPEEYAEWEKLTDKYGDAVWDDKYMLRDYLKHDELFKRYPSLRIASLVFEPMRAGERGYYNRSDNSIHVNELLKSEPESTLLHEIQHFVQGRDNRPGGANPEYWRLMTENADEWIDRNLLLSRKQKIIERMNTIEQQVGYSDFYDSLLDREEAGELTSEQVDALDREFVARYPELEALRNELYNDVYMKLKELGKGKRDPNELYRNTAGEIEARETASRRNMTAEERRQKTPDLGWDRAVFAEDAGTTAEIKYPVYTPEAIHENQRKLRDMQPVTKLTGNEFAKGDTDLMTQVLNYFDSLGNSVHSERFGDVALTKSSWRSERRHGMTALKANTFAAVPDVIRNGVVIDYMQKHDGAVDRIVAAAPIQIGTDADYYVGVMLQRDQQSQRLYLHDVVALKNQGQKNKTQTWHQNPDVSRSSSNLDISSILRNALDGNTSAQNTFGFTPEQIAKGTVPLSEAMQYGKTPEQAMMEANARAEGERVRQAREEQAAAEQQERLDRITNGKNRDILQRVYEAQERAERVASRHALERATTRATASDADSYIDHTQEDIAIDLVNSLESERRFLTNLRNGWHLSDAELVNAERMAAGRGPVTEMASHRYELVETYARAMRQYNEDMQPYYAFQRGLDDARLRRATELIKDSDNWKDSRGNLGLQIRTPERVLRKVMGDTAETEAIYQAYFAPVLKHDAEAIRWENTQRERLKGIMEGLSHEDSVYMHMKNRAELSPKNEAMQKQLADYVKKNKSKIHFKQAESAMQKLYEMTSEMHPQVSEAGVRNGYAPLEFRQKYIPSLTPTKEGKWYNRILRKVGVETMVDELPTEIAGRTEDRRPGRQYAGFYNQREGINTEFDAFKAMDNYISGASNAIFHTDDIQNLRVLEDAIRSKYSDEGSRAELEAIRKDPDINIEDKEQKISKIWERNSGTLPSFPSWIAEYTNILAGKKSRTDRSAEQMFGRGLYRAMSDVEGKVAADMVGGNLSTAISNFIPLAQGSGEVRYSSMMRAMLDYGADLAKRNPAFHEDSDFLTNRRGSERVIKTKLQKASDAAGWTMNAIDNLSSEVMVRARYLDNVEKRHMSTEAALQEADRWAAGLIGDRARGAKPVIMESKSPLIKAFTMFQLEVMNQYDHLFSDIPHYLRVQGKSKAQIAAGTAAALLQVFVMSHLFNDAREKLTGSRGAFDPIEMVNDFVGRLTGYALPNIFDLLGEMMGDGIDEDDFRAEKSETAWDNVKETAQDIASNVPFVSGPLGAVFGAGNSRLPIQSVIPNIDNIMTAQGEEARSMALKKELSKPLYGFLLPFGGLQAKKTVEGAATMFAGGSYSYDKKGEKILQFPVYGQTPRDWAQAMLFGKSSLKTAQDWADNGYDSLNAKETKAFDTLRGRMSWHRDENGNAVDNSEAVFAAIKAMRAISDETDDRDIAAGKIREMLFNDSALSAGQKDFLDRELVSGGESGVYTSRDAFDISQTVREGRQLDAAEAVKHGITPEMFADWDNVLQDALGDDNLSSAADYVEGGDNKLYAKNTVLANVLDEFVKQTDATEAEKQAFADYVLISAMSESDREKWNEEVKGAVNAADYVRFKGDLATYSREFKGTGADNAASVANILNSYTNLTDEQRGVLMNTYSDSAKSNPFTVSELEKKLTDNSFYKALDDAGRTTLREFCNEYTQAVSEGKELAGWKAKAYTAKEAGIEPEVYALFQTALKANDYDGNGSYKSAEIEAAVKCIPGLTDKQRGYLWQAAKGGKTSKNNPWGATDVSKYSSSKSETVNPVEGGTLSSGFGWRSSPTAGASTSHKAIDIAAPAGTAVKAAMGGTVIAVTPGYNGGYGNTVEIDHGNGIITKYHHMQDGSISGMSVGQEVKAGQQIGKVGSTGISTGPHLDFQVVKDSNFVDPRNYIPGYGEGTSATISAAQAAAAAAKESRKSSSGSKGRSSGGSSGLRKPSAPKGLPVFR